MTLCEAQGPRWRLVHRCGLQGLTVGRPERRPAAAATGSRHCSKRLHAPRYLTRRPRWVLLTDCTRGVSRKSLHSDPNRGAGCQRALDYSGRPQRPPVCAGRRKECLCNPSSTATAPSSGDAHLSKGWWLSLAASPRHSTRPLHAMPGLVVGCVWR